ncbi:MAG: hypothetical protein ACFB6R_10865 [Alphaproteobacteria bacterium]
MKFVFAFTLAIMLGMVAGFGVAAYSGDPTAATIAGAVTGLAVFIIERPGKRRRRRGRGPSGDGPQDRDSWWSDGGEGNGDGGGD